MCLFVTTYQSNSRN